MKNHNYSIEIKKESIFLKKNLDVLLKSNDLETIRKLLIENRVMNPSFGLIHHIEYMTKKRIITGQFLFDNYGLKSRIKGLKFLKNFREYIEFSEKKINDLYGNNYSYFHSVFGKLIPYEEIINEFPDDFPVYKQHKEYFSGVKKEYEKEYLKKEPAKSYLRVRNRYKHGKTMYKPSEVSLFDSNRSVALPFNYFLERTIQRILTSLLIYNENEFRLHKRLPEVGKGWVSETVLFNKINEEFKKLKVIHHANPKWLGLQHLDIWIPKYNIGIEYQGLQHDKPVDFFGGKDAFQKTKERDQRKRSLCKSNDCYLIEVRPGYEINEVFEIIKGIIINRKNKSLAVDLPVKSKIKSYRKVEKINVKNKNEIFDCYKNKIVTKEDILKNEGKTLNLDQLNYCSSLKGRYIYNEGKEKNKTYLQWKTIEDTFTSEIGRYSMRTFSQKINVNQNNLWKFFKGKQKMFKQRYRIIK